MKVKLFTHIDLDGIGCAILGKLAFKNIDVEYCNYNDVNTKIKQFIDNKYYNNYDFVYITDISVNKDVAELINNMCSSEKFLLIDHHSTALWLNNYSWCIVKEYDTSLDEKVSGTYLFFQYLLREIGVIFPLRQYKTIRYFIDLVRKYDTWLWATKYNDDTPKKWNDLLYILGRDRFIDKVLLKIQTNNLNFDDTDNLLLELEQEKIDQYVETKNKQLIVKNIQEYNAGVVFAEQYISELGNRLSQMHPELDFIVVINIEQSCSYRTVKDGIHLGNIAEIYGGGGHQKAAGSPIDDKIREKLVDMMFKKDMFGC